MANSPAVALAAVAFFGLQCMAKPALADNQMGYQELSAQQANSLPRRGGLLGIDVGAAQRINDGGLNFELLQVKSVRRGSPGAQAGLKPGDQIIAANGQVFPSVAAFGAFVGSMPPGQHMTLDYMPAGSGPQQAQRVNVTLGGTGQAAQGQQQEKRGMSTGTKLAIGAGAAALFGCYEAGCFSHSKTQPTNSPQQ